MVENGNGRKKIGIIGLIVAVAMSGALGTNEAHTKDVPPLVTERPTQGASSTVVFPGYFQVETGLLYTEEDERSGRSRTIEGPGMLFRFGLFDRAELRLNFRGWVGEDVEKEEGFGDSEVGLKFYLWEEAGFTPETALITSLSLPTGDDDFSSDRADPSFRFACSHTLTPRLSLGYNVGAAWQTSEGRSGGRDTLSVFQYTMAAVAGLTCRLAMFAEFYGYIPINARGNPANAFDTGFTYLARDNVQLDVVGGVGISQDADDWFVGAGVSFRFPR